MRLGGKSKELGQHLKQKIINNIQQSSKQHLESILHFILFASKNQKKKNLSYIQVVNPSINYIEKERSNAYIFELAKRIRIIRE